jgi:hypothetical protein
MDGQKAFLTGKLKAKGNIMLATKLAAVLQVNIYITVIKATTDLFPRWPRTKQNCRVVPTAYTCTLNNEYHPSAL